MIKIILTSLLIISIVISIYIRIMSKPLTNNEAMISINNLLNKEVKKKKTVSSALVLAQYSGHFEVFTAGIEDDKEVSRHQPFHVASVGKAFTSTIIGSLVDNHKITLSDYISTYLPKELLENLFVYNDHDYSKEVTIAQLLNHTSGVADYFADKTRNSKEMTQLLIDHPDTFFTPEDLLDFTRDHQIAVGYPGMKYHYSDTGFILLGLIIESVTQSTYHQQLHTLIFEPLEMNDSYLMFYSEPINKNKQAIADIWLNGTEISSYQSLSVDWAGGGIISTLDDLAIFLKALNNHELISKETLADLYNFDQVFMKGIHYGKGFMEYHFTEFFPTLGFLPNLKGHMGVLGTQMLYDKDSDTIYICSFGSTDYSAGSVKTMIKILSTLKRIKN